MHCSLACSLAVRLQELLLCEPKDLVGASLPSTLAPSLLEVTFHAPTASFYKKRSTGRGPKISLLLDG